MHGSILGKNAQWHVRTSPNGHIFSARTGNPQKYPSPKQLAHQQRMSLAVARYQEIIADPELTDEWKKKLSDQTRYKNLRALVLATMLTTADGHY